jgi:gluconate 2-dehydrogenase
MTKPKVLIPGDLDKEATAYIAEHCEIVTFPMGRKLDQQTLYELVRDIDGMLQAGVRIEAGLLAQAPKLKIVANNSVGYNNFDIDAMKARGVVGTHTPYVLDDTVADLVFALILATARRVAELDRLVKEGVWGPALKGEDAYGLDVHHRTLGIIGMGRIGEAIAKRARFGFDMDVLYTNRNRKPEAERTYGARYLPLEDLLRESDFVVVMVPLTKETQRMIRKEHFQMMKPTAVFINASRGQTVDEQALIEALASGTIYAAGLDVFEKEPVDPANPLLKMPNVITLPHIGSATPKTRADMAMVAARNLVAGVTGQTPPNIVPELRP